jgi:hypothetical protein
LLVLALVLLPAGTAVAASGYDDFLNQLRAGDVTSVTVFTRRGVIEYGLGAQQTQTVKYPRDKLGQIVRASRAVGLRPFINRNPPDPEPGTPWPLIAISILVLIGAVAVTVRLLLPGLRRD